MNKKTFNKFMMILHGILLVIWAIDIFLTIWATEVSKISHVCLIFLIIFYVLIDFIKYLTNYLDDKIIDRDIAEYIKKNDCRLDSQLYFKIIDNESNEVVSYCHSHKPTYLSAPDVIDSETVKYIKENDCQLESISKAEYDEYHSSLGKTQVEDQKSLPDNSVVDNAEEKNDVLCGDCKYLMYSDCYGECSKAYKGIVNADDSCGRGVKKEKV